MKASAAMTVIEILVIFTFRAETSESRLDTMSRTEPSVRTQLSLQGISRLVEGTLDNPAQMLGPHAIECGDRSALSVRAFLPSSEQAWVIVTSKGWRMAPLARAVAVS